MLMVICVGYLSVTVCRLPITDMSICCTDDAISHLLTLTHLNISVLPAAPSHHTTITILHHSRSLYIYIIIAIHLGRSVQSQALHYPRRLWFLVPRPLRTLLLQLSR